MIAELLKKNYTIEEADRIQLKYCEILKKTQQEILNISDVHDIRYIVGADISYVKKEDKEIGVSCAVLFDLKENEVKCKKFAQDTVEFPYKPGFLGFRECFLLAKAILKIPHNYDVIMCDGHGIIHPRRFGEAVHLGFALDKPSIGIAKNPFYGFSEWRTLKREKGEKTPVWEDDPKKHADILSELLGYAICSNENSKPVFVSVGYKTSIELALNIVLKASKNHRLPEPLYLANRFSRQRIDSLNL